MKHIDVFPPDSRAKKINPELGPEPRIHPTCRIVDGRIGAWTELMANTSIVESTFGDYSYCAGDVSIIYSDVGKFCSIASHVRVNPGNHPMDRVTQHHCTYRRVQFGFGERDEEEFFDWRRSARCEIGHDVWIGHAAIVMPGVRVGMGAVIGSGAVVTRDIGPYAIAVGVPARPVRKRFPDDIIEGLMETRWWDWDHETLRERFGDLMDPKRFIEKYGGA